MIAVKINGVEILIDVTAYVKWENRARLEGKTVEETMSIFLSKQGTTNL